MKLRRLLAPLALATALAASAAQGENPKSKIENPPSVRAGVTPKVRADNSVGQWNTFEITLRSERLSVILNGQTVIDHAELPGLPATGPFALQHHGGWKDGSYNPASSLVQFRNATPMSGSR
jgi:hypothetical protein